MLVLSVISQKGGVGKSTVVANVAVEFMKRGKTVLVLDLDPQASVTLWAAEREDEEMMVVSLQPPMVKTMIEKSKKMSVDIVIIDTAGKSSDAAAYAAEHSDKVLIPVKASTLDLTTVESTIRLIVASGLKQRQCFGLINTAPPFGEYTEQTKEVLEDKGISVLKTKIGNRIAYVNSLTLGQGVVEYEPSGKASKEIKELVSELEEQEIQ